MSPAGGWRRIFHRRTLWALGAVLLVASAVLYATRNDPETPYRPGETVEGITDVNRRGSDAASWGIRWRDVAAESGLNFRHFSGGVRSTQLPEDMGSGCAFADYDRDGDWDLFVADTAGPLTMTAEELKNSPGGCRLYRNDGGKFTDVTEAAGLGGLKGTYMGAAWGDYDNDGYPDLAVTSYGEIRLFHNRGDGTFEDVSKRSGVGGRRGFWTGAAWGDVDGDGRLDLYVCGYVDYKYNPADAGRASKFRHADSPFTINPSSYAPIRKLYFHNEGNGRFTEMAEEAGISNPTGRSLSATFADFNGDGKPDLYVANDVSEGALFVNIGDGLFEDKGHEAHVADYRGAMGIAVGDADGDGALDMFVTHWIAEANAFYRNRMLEGPGKLDFEDAAERFGLGEVSTDDIAWGTAFLDIDGDGWPDLVVANGSTFEDPADRRRLVPMRMRVFRNLGGSKGFIDVPPAPGDPISVARVHRGLAVADVDGDLRQEVAVVVHEGNLLLLKSEGGPAAHRIAFRVEGTKSNRSGFGTRLELESGGRRQIHEIGAGSSYLSQNAPEAIFGMGSAQKADRVTVRWPSGLVQKFENLAADRAYLLVEGESSPRAVASAREKTLAFWDVYRKARDLAAAGKREEATAAYRDALAIDPRHEDSLYALGNLLLDGGDIAGARESFQKQLAVQAHSGRAHGALGDLYADPRSGSLYDLSAARREYEQAGRLNAEETGWVVRVAEVDLARGDLAGAERGFRHVLVTHPRSFAALYFLGFAADRGGRRDEARRLFDQAFAALAPPPGAPAPSEGDVKKPERLLPKRGVFSRHWDLLARGPLSMEQAYAALESELKTLRRPS